MGYSIGRGFDIRNITERDASVELPLWRQANIQLQ